MRILVTGAAGGLGLAAARELIAAGHRVVVHARTPDRLPPDLRGAAADAVFADLASLDQTAQLAERLNGAGAFDAVIHNAGIIDGPDVFAVNVVAPYVLASLTAPAARTVVLSSSMHLSGSADPDTSRPSYSDSKLQVTALAMALARLRPDTVAHAVDPGWVPTRMGGPGASDDLDEGHRTQVSLATADLDEVDPRTGGYWYHHAPRPPHPATLDTDFQDTLLARLASVTGVTLR
jgi:NAD(P)-dependent dehydrogenase (short-subunit alcohol dehydrogenase family)